MYRCDPCWQNDLEGTPANYELQAKQVKYLNYAQRGFHKHLFTKVLSKDPDATYIN